MLHPSKDGNAEVLCHQLQDEEMADEIHSDIIPNIESDSIEVEETTHDGADEFDDGANALALNQLKVRDAITEMLNLHKEQVESTPSPGKVNPVVNFAGNSIYKSTLVNQLNNNPFLSNDSLLV
jgi:hypothetical protein